MATTEEIRADLAEIVNEVAGVDADDVQLDKAFVDDLDVDSLSMVEVVVAARRSSASPSPTTRSRTSRPSATPSRSSSAPKADPPLSAVVGRPRPGRPVTGPSPSPRNRTTDLKRIHMPAKRVVVTGLGTTSPLGGDVASTWEALLKGQSGVRHLTDDWAEQMPVKIAARVAVEPTEVLERVRARRLDRTSQFAVIAAEEAWKDAGLEDAEIDKDRLGRRDRLRHRRRDHAARQLRRAARQGPAPGLPARRADADAQRAGGQRQPDARRPGGRQHAGLGLRLRQRGHLPRPRPDPPRPGRHHPGRRHRGRDPPAADGGVRQHDGAVQERRRPDHRLPARGTSPATASCSARAPASWSSSPRSTPRPAVRGSTPRCSAPASPPTPTTSPSPTPPVAAAPARSSGRWPSPRSTPADIAHINAHATSTPQGDIAEGLMIHATLGSHANEVVVTSTKSMTGHLLGGAGALESIATVLAIHHRLGAADDQPRQPGPAGRARHPAPGPRAARRRHRGAQQLLRLRRRQRRRGLRERAE